MRNDDALLIGKLERSIVRVEIARSFAYKLNCANYGGAQYESRDFFCSQKAECSIDDAEDVSEMLYRFCQVEVRRAVKEYIVEMHRQQGRVA